MRNIEDEDLGRTHCWIINKAEAAHNEANGSSHSQMDHQLAADCAAMAAACDGKVYAPVSMKNFIRVKLRLERMAGKLSQSYQALQAFCTTNNIDLIEDREKTILMRIR